MEQVKQTIHHLNKCWKSHIHLEYRTLPFVSIKNDTKHLHRPMSEVFWSEKGKLCSVLNTVSFDEQAIICLMQIKT